MVPEQAGSRAKEVLEKHKGRAKDINRGRSEEARGGERRSGPPEHAKAHGYRARQEGEGAGGGSVAERVRAMRSKRG